MAFLIFLLILLIPAVEIAVFIKVGGAIGVGPTIAIVILTAIMGTWLLRQQGISVLFRIRENLEANKMPVRELFDGVCLVLAGALLLTPGFVTDALGFLLFIPPVRGALAAYIAGRVLANGSVRYTHTEFHGGGFPPGPDGPVIDGEFTDVTPDDGAGKPKGTLPDGRDPER